MGFGTITNKSSGFGSVGKEDSAGLDSLIGLRTLAEQSGMSEEAAKITDTENNLSFLQRVERGFGALNPAEAILTAKETNDPFAGIGKYITGAAGSVGAAVTGKDMLGSGERRYFKDVAEEMGVENEIAKFGIGFVGDVLLDPSTYFGGAIAKGVGKVAGKAGSTALKGVGKVAPEVETGLRMAGKGLKDATGRAFQFGYKSTKGAKEDVLTYLSKEQQAKLGLAASNLDRLGTGVLTPAQREELALKLIAGKRAEFVAREAGASSDEILALTKKATETTDPVVRKTIEAQIARSKKLSEGIVENPYETYFPFIKKDKVDRFLNESKGMQVGSEGYRKQFKNLLTNDNLELDPAKAFFTRENQIVSDKMTRNFLGGFVKKYGKGIDEFKNADEAAAAGYKMIREKGIFGKEVGYVNKYDADLIRDSINPEFQTINMLAKSTGFDAVTSLFKRSVTGLFAPFHVRNYISGTIQNFETLGIDALNPKNIAVGQKIAYALAKGDKLKGVMNIGGKDMKMSKILKPFKDRFFGDTFYNTDFNMALEKGSQIKSALGTFSKERLKETVKTVGLGEEAIPFKVARGIGQYIEHQQKATAYITALNQGKNIDEALKLAEAAGFDYRALTRFESQIMKRIIPFYSFTRKNIELQLKTAGEHPERINQVIRFFDNMGTGEEMTEEEKTYLPKFIKESLGVRLEDTPDGLKQYISSFGTPIEAFTQLFGSNPVLRALSMTNPILKAPIEIGIGKDSFRQTDLKDVYQADEYSAAPKVIKDLLDIKEVKKKIYKKNAKGEMEESGEKIVYAADPVRLLIARSLFTSRGVSYLDQVFDGDPNKLAHTLKLTTGVKPTAPIDLEAQKYFKETEQKRELEDLLMRTGEVKKFETIYVPKDNKKKGFGK